MASLELGVITARSVVIGFFFGVSFLAAGYMAYCRLNSPQYLTFDQGPVKADAIVVLGGAVDRAARAAELFQAGEASRVLVCGTGDWMINSLYLKQHGVPLDKITVESESTTTRDNARFSAPILRRMKAERVILVTSWYHSRRAMACFKHESAEIEFYSRPSYFGYPGKASRSRYVDAMRRIEVVKLFGYAVRYGIWAF